MEIKKFSTNKYEAVQINDLIFRSDTILDDNVFNHSFTGIIKNVNLMEKLSTLKIKVKVKYYR